MLLSMMSCIMFFANNAIYDACYVIMLFYPFRHTGIALMPASQMYFHQGHQIASRKLTVDKKGSAKSPTSPAAQDSDKKSSDKKSSDKKSSDKKSSDKKSSDKKSNDKKDSKKAAKERKLAEPQAAAASSETPSAATADSAPKKKKKGSKFELI